MIILAVILIPAIMLAIIIADLAGWRSRVVDGDASTTVRTPDSAPAALPLGG